MIEQWWSFALVAFACYIVFHKSFDGQNYFMLGLDYSYVARGRPREKVPDACGNSLGPILTCVWRSQNGVTSDDSSNSFTISQEIFAPSHFQTTELFSS
jgi:hypothetical protein